jgi:hypothetical protein
MAGFACASPKPTPAPAPAPSKPTPVPAKPPAGAQPPEPVRAPAESTARAERHARTPVRLALVGDINLGTMTIPGGVPLDSARALLQRAKPFLTGDLVIGNFEGVLADSGETEKCGKRRSVKWTEAVANPAVSDSILAAQARRTADSLATLRRHAARRHAKAPPKTEPVRCYAFLTPTWLAPRLKEAGFTHLNLANNHANDFGIDGRQSTEATLAAIGLRTYGPLGRIVIDTVRRGEVMTTVGVVGFTTYPFAYDLLDVPRSVAVVDSIRPLVDLLVVTFHGGAEGSAAQHVPFAAESLGHEPRGDLRTWAHAVVDAGADLVVGHGPHVLRGVELWQKRLIAYSLGNFANYRGFNLSGPQGLTGVLQVEFAADGSLIGAKLEPMRQLPTKGPARDSTGAALDLIRSLSQDDFGADAPRVESDGTIRGH